MKKLIQRLNRLESRRGGGGDGPWNWTAKYLEVKRRAFAPMSPEETVWLNDLHSTNGPTAREASIAAHRERWDRFVNAFDRAVKEVPAPYPMCLADLFGQW